MQVVMDELAKKCIHDHRNPIVKLNLPARKLFLGAKTEDETRVVSGHREHLKTVLGHLRVEKRSSRAQAVWLPDQSTARVTKVVKNLVKYFGYQNKNGIFLYPEEMLFLIEINRLEVSSNGSPITIEKAYELVFKSTNVGLAKYQIYKKLALLGYKLVRFEQFETRISAKTNDLKRVREGDTGNVRKKIREADTDELLTGAQNSVSKDIECVRHIFREINKIMPKCHSAEAGALKPDYYVYLPANLGKVAPDFSLFVCEGDIDRSSFSGKLPSIYATCIDDVAFYKFINVQLPCI